MNDTQHFDAVRGLPLTDYMLAYGGSLVLGIGERVEDTRETEWNLFVESAWRLEQNGQPILASLDTCVETKEEAGPFLAVLDRLCGETIISIETGQNVKDLAINFTSGYVLATFSHSLDGSSWVFRHRDGANIGEC